MKTPNKATYFLHRAAYFLREVALPTVLAVLIVCASVLMLFLGYVFSTVAQAVLLLFYWRWFVMDAFHVPALSLTQALGIILMLVLGMALTGNYNAFDDKAKQTWAQPKRFAVTQKSWYVLLLSLVMGWLYWLLLQIPWLQRVLDA